MANNVSELKRIAASNPFNEVRECWRGKLKEMHNATYEELHTHQYILPCDECNKNFMNIVRRGMEYGDLKRLRTELIPLPFCGNPRADIWYVNINPRGNDIDLYDFFSIAQKLKRKIAENLAKQTSRTIDDFRFCKTGEDERLALYERQRLLIDQLDLTREQHDFYPLCPSFKTIEHEGRMLIGSWEWWRSALCINNENSLFYRFFTQYDYKEIPAIMGKNVFVIECYPYASEQQSTWQKKSVYPSCHPYRKFLFAMLKYAEENRKYIVFRSELGFNSMRLTEIVSNPVFLRNNRRIRFVRSNLQGEINV